MTTLPLPWFHSRALEQRFLRHLNAVSHPLLTPEAAQWLRQLAQPERDHQAHDEVRVDGLSVITAQGHAVELPLSMMISTSQQPWVAHYHPISGLQLFDDRRHLKHYLLDRLTGPDGDVALSYLHTQEENRQLHLDGLDEVQVTLMEGSVFDTLMLDIQHRLSEQLRGLRQLLLDQPIPDEQVTRGSAAVMANRLAHYWREGVDQPALPAEQLTHQLRTQLITELTRLQWDGTLPAGEHDRLWAWLQGQVQPSPLSCFILQGSTAEGRQQPLTNSLVLTGDSTAAAYFFNAAMGLVRYADRSALLAALTDLEQRARWLSCVPNAQQPTFKALPITGIELVHEPDSSGGLHSYTRRLLQVQHSAFTDSSPAAATRDMHTLCEQALALHQRLAPSLQRLAPPFAADPRDSLVSLMQLTGAAQDDLQQPQRRVSALTELHIQYASYLERGPDLRWAALQALELQLASILPNGPPARSLYLIDRNRSAAATPWVDSLWTNEPLAAGTSWQIGTVVAEGSRQVLQQMPSLLIEHITGQARRSLYRELKIALGHREATGQAYQRSLRRSLFGVEWALFKQSRSVASPLVEALLRSDPVQAWQHKTGHPAHANADALMLSQSADASGAVVIWSCETGFQLFESQEAAHRNATQWSPRPAELSPGLSNWTALPGDALNTLNSLDSEDRQRTALQAYDQLRNQGWPAESLPDLLREAMTVDSLQQQLYRLQDMARGLVAKAALPAWLQQAAVDDQQHYLRALGLNLLASPAEDDYLFGVPDIGTYTHGVLQRRLNQDFTHDRFNPKAIFITTARYVPAPVASGEIPSGIPAASIVRRQTLIEYALNHYRDWDAAVTRIELGEGHVAPAVLDADYCRRLVREADVGAHYQALLKQTFDPTDLDYSRRLTLYARQLPGQLLECAWRTRLQQALPLQAVELITRVARMPDPTVRQPLNGQPVLVTALQLIAKPGMKPDTVPGCYLFRAGEEGPLVLYLPYEATYTFQAFDSGTALLTALAADPTLQTRLLARMPENLRPRYAHGGFREPHLGRSGDNDFNLTQSTRTGPALACNPIAGNALRYLFVENGLYLQALAATQWVTAEQVRWQALVNVLSLAWEQLSMFLPGKVGLAVAAWQTELALLDIAQNVQQNSWGQTLAQLTCALVQGLAMSQGMAQPALQGSAREHFWQIVHSAPEYGLALTRYEAPTETLRSLTFQPPTRTYLNAGDQTHFLSLNGKVYRTRQEQDRWYLAGQPDDDLGPRVLLDAEQTWIIDPDQDLAISAGGVPSSLGSRLVRWSLSRNEIIIHAVGCQQIRRLRPHRADILYRAHRDALGYLGNALVSLRTARTVGSADAHTLKVFKHFFGVAQVTALLIERVQEVLEKLARVMASRAYSPTSSKRYVMASRLSEQSSVGIAFVSVQDPQGQVFLMDDFFDFETARLLPLKPPYTPTQTDAVSKAMILLHEFSHIACDTRDIRYIEAATPYTDRLRPGVRRAWLVRQHDVSFSHLTPARQLFVVRDGATGQVRDIRNEDRKGRALILRLAGSPDLDDARRRFQTDADIRAQILLKNADSVTLLIYRLGNRTTP